VATSPNGTPMRKNARANRERILAAAEAVFGAAGELGSTEDVADRAGVGIATVFRPFPRDQARGSASSGDERSGYNYRLLPFSEAAKSGAG